MAAYLESSMLVLWVDDVFHRAMTAEAGPFPAAMFSPGKVPL